MIEIQQAGNLATQLFSEKIICFETLKTLYRARAASGFVQLFASEDIRGRNVEFARPRNDELRERDLSPTRSVGPKWDKNCRAKRILRSWQLRFWMCYNMCTRWQGEQFYLIPFPFLHMIHIIFRGTGKVVWNAPPRQEEDRKRESRNLGTIL